MPSPFPNNKKQEMNLSSPAYNLTINIRISIKQVKMQRLFQGFLIPLWVPYPGSDTTGISLIEADVYAPLNSAI